MASFGDDVIDVKTSDAKNTIEDIWNFSKNVMKDSAIATFSGVINTVSDAGLGCMKVLNGDYDGAANIAKKRIEGVITGTIGTVKSGFALAEASYKAVANDEDFLTHENQIHATRLCQFGIYSLAGSAVVGDSVPEGDNCQLHGDACNLPGVENGVFKGDAQELKQLTDVGQIPNTTHLEESEITRSSAAKNDFLQSHSIEDPKGWEVHHVRPLSEGGADHPNNMVLINSEDHAKITAAHADYYGWKHK